MPALVIGRQHLLLLGHDQGASLGTHHDLVLGILELGHRHDALAASRRHKSRFVDKVHEVRPRETRGATRYGLQVDIGGQRHLAHMHLQDAFAADDIRVRDDDLTIEAAGTQQGRIENVRPVGRGDQDDTLVGLETVHLDEQLVQRLLAFVVAAAEPRTTMPTHGVDLVDEDDARRVLLGLFEHVADTARADADEHLDEVRTRDGEERDIGFTRDGASQKRLTGTGRSDQKDAAGNSTAETLELLRVAKKLDDLLEIFLGLVDARHILEGHASVGFRQKLGLRLSEPHGFAAGPLHLPGHEDPDADEGKQRQSVHQQRHQPGITIGRWLGRDLHVLLVEVLNEARIVGRVGGEGAAAVVVMTGDLGAGDRNVTHLVLVDLVQQLTEGDVLRLSPLTGVLEQEDQRHHQKEDDHPEGEIPEIRIHFGLVLAMTFAAGSKVRLRPKGTLLEGNVSGRSSLAKGSAISPQHRSS